MEICRPEFEIIINPGGGGNPNLHKPPLPTNIGRRILFHKFQIKYFYLVEEIYTRELENAGKSTNHGVPKSILKKSAELQRDIKVIHFEIYG